MCGGYGGCAGRDEAVGADDRDSGEKSKDGVIVTMLTATTSW